MSKIVIKFSFRESILAHLISLLVCNGLDPAVDTIIKEDYIRIIPAKYGQNTASILVEGIC